MVKFRKYTKINEELGISKDVQDESLKRINDINKYLSQKQNYKTYYLNGDYTEPAVYGINLQTNVLLFDDFPVDFILQIYFCNGEDKCNEIAKRVKYPMRFFFDDNKDLLFVRFPLIRNEDFDFDAEDVQITKSTNPIYGKLSHEIKHAYQKAMMLRNSDREKLLSYRDRKVYDTVTKYALDNPNGVLSSLMFNVYYMFPVEITANIEQLYTMTLRNANDINDALDYVCNSKMYKKIKDILKDLEYIKGNQDTKDKLNILVQPELNRNMDWVIRHLEKGLNFAYKKFRQLEKLLRKKYAEFQNK